MVSSLLAGTEQEGVVGGQGDGYWGSSHPPPFLARSTAQPSAVLGPSPQRSRPAGEPSVAMSGLEAASGKKPLIEETFIATGQALGEALGLKTNIGPFG